MGLSLSLYLEKVKIKAKVEKYFKLIAKKDERVIHYLGCIAETSRDPTISTYRKELEIRQYRQFIENEVTTVRQTVHEIEQIASCLSEQWEQIISVRLRMNWPFCLGDRTFELSRKFTRSLKQGTSPAISKKSNSLPPLDGTTA